MDSLIKPNFYTTDSILEKELELIFSKTWNFVGFKSDLLSNNDFIVSTVSGIQVLVQNVKGNLVAFNNVCPHRHSLIQSFEKGNRVLMCPYHGWSFNSDGELKGLPKKPLFNFSDKELSCLKLQKFSLETLGDLIFVNLSENPQTLNQYLGSFYQPLRLISQNLGRRVDVSKLTISANWKIVVENTLESYHVASVHSNTFDKLGAKGLDFTIGSNHSLWKASLELKENEGKNKFVNGIFRNRKYKINGYEHYLIFPNLLISTTYGISFNISIVNPVKSNTTDFTSYMFLSSHNDNEVLFDAYRESLVKFNKEVFLEDKAVCELVHKGTSQSKFSGKLSEEEQRVFSFQESYLSFING